MIAHRFGRPMRACIMFCCRLQVICSIITLDRVQLKEKVINAAEVLTCILEIPRLSDFLNSLYKCDYGAGVDSHRVPCGRRHTTLHHVPVVRLQK